MAPIRTVLFWFHLTAGVLAGVIVLIMSATGVALTFEKQLLEWADRRAWSAPPPSGRARLSPETLLAKVGEAQPEAAPTALILRADDLAPATVSMVGGAAVLVDPYEGAIVGRTDSALRSFFRTITSCHRWLALQGSARSSGRAATGAANLAFLFIVLSGIYLWVPSAWSWGRVRQVLWMRRGLRGKARDFSWHNAIGIWSAVPLTLIVAGAVPISYPWAGNLLYLVVGEAPPSQPSLPVPLARDPGARIDLAGLDMAYRIASAHVDEWRAITVRLPVRPQDPFAFTIDEGYAGQPQKRGTLIVTRSGAVQRWETFGDLSPGRRLRSWLRFVHTGEYYGLVGQAVAGLASAAATVLVWTGLALALRRFVTWRSRVHTTRPIRKAA